MSVQFNNADVPAVKKEVANGAFTIKDVLALIERARSRGATDDAAFHTEPLNGHDHAWIEWWPTKDVQDA